MSPFHLGFRGIWVSVLFASVTSSAATSVVGDPYLVRLFRARDHLGARLRVKELVASTIDAKLWKWLEAQVLSHPEWGDDLLPGALESGARGKDWFESSPLQQMLDEADEAMLTKQFGVAALKYREVIGRVGVPELSTTGIHYARLALARALYSDKRFDEAYEEAKKIPPKFSRYRQVLFLRFSL